MPAPDVIMPSERKELAEVSPTPKVEPSLKKHAVTLYAIICFKLAHGLAFLLLALWIYKEANSVPRDYENFMHAPAVEWLFGHLKMHPESQFFINLAVRIGHLTEARVHHLALGSLLFSLFPLVEGIGMLFRVSWAGWLAISESAFFIPIELHTLLNPQRPFSWSLLVVTITNITIVWYLYANRNVLFRHHCPRRRSDA